MLTEGAVLGKYRILRLLGTGGMADVYEAEDQLLGRRVALKVLPPEFGRDPKAVARFEKEVRAAASLNHASIVTIFEVDKANNVHFCAMRLLPGGDLRSRIDRGLSPAQAVTILRELASAFMHAHGAGFVHRDVKPENILFDEQGRAILTDFGIAKAMSSDHKMTATGVSIGTPRYISPEQARGTTVDGRSDLYSLGVILFEMLTGKLPFEAEDSLALIFKHVTEPVPRLPAAHAAFQSLVDTLMAKDPAQRPASAEALLALLAPFGDSVALAPAAPAAPPSSPSATPADRSTIVTGEREYAQKLVAEEARQREDAGRRSGNTGKLPEAAAAAARAAAPEASERTQVLNVGDFKPEAAPAAADKTQILRPADRPPLGEPAPERTQVLSTAAFEKTRASAPEPAAPARTAATAVAGTSPAPRQLSVPPSPASGRRHLMLSPAVALVCGGALAIVLGGWWLLSGGDKGPPEPPAASESPAQLAADQAAAPEPETVAVTPTPAPVQPVAAAPEPAAELPLITELAEADLQPTAAETAAAARAAAEAEQARKAAAEARRKTPPAASATPTAAMSKEQRMAMEKARCKRHVSELFPGWAFTYADIAAYPDAKKKADGSVETPPLSADFDAPKRYVIDVNGCIVAVFE